GCGFEGNVPEERVIDNARAYVDAGLLTIALADTAGHAYPEQVERLHGRLLSLHPGIEAACHLHDTYGAGMANVYAALRAGAVSLESSFAGLGGCPFTKVAAGNVATEDLVHTLQRDGKRTDVDLAGLIAVAKEVEAFFGREMPGRVHRTGPVPQLRKEESPA
ncbi:MAG: hydroxymethylglutaryl-CoA lyase, partial [Thermoanaerobaculia bacterium]|nr:hydroxymethylglutaryl-CoA lyase [Thermoanaerobaculia bacterium]